MTPSAPQRSAGVSRGWMRTLALVLYSLVLLLQAGLLASTLLRKQAYLPVLGRDYRVALVLATCVPVALGMTAISVAATSLAAQGRRRYIPIGIVAAVTPLACCLGFFWWMGAAYGTGSSQPAAVLTTAGSTYRLEYATPGDPPQPSLLLLECKPVPALCREVGGITNVSHSGSFPDVELQAGSEGVTVILDGAPIATYSDGVLRCLPGQGVHRCSD